MNYKIHEALQTLEYLIRALPKLMYYESTEQYAQAFETIKKYITEYESRIEDDWK